MPMVSVSYKNHLENQAREFCFFYFFYLSSSNFIFPFTFLGKPKKTTYIPCQSLTLTLKLTKNFSSFQVKNRKRNWARKGGEGGSASAFK
jgi:hypothetical protein